MTGRPGRFAAALALGMALLALGLLSAAPGAHAAHAPAVGPNVRVSGNVTDSLLGTPIAGALVVAGTGQSTHSAASGQFVLQLPSGANYQIKMSATNYHSASTSVYVNSGKATPPVNLALRPYEYPFTGSVTNFSSGDPIADAYVLLSPGNLATTTAPDGSFQIALENGTYNATVSAVDFATVTFPVFVAGQAVNHAFPLNSTLACSGCSAPPPPGGSSPGGFLGLGSGSSLGLLVVVLAIVIGVLGTTAYFVWRTRVKPRNAGKSLFALPFAAEDPGAPPPTESDRRRATHHRRR